MPLPVSTTTETTLPTGVTSLDEVRAERERRERRGRVQTALRTGERVTSADLREGEYYAPLHRGILATLAQARRLSGNQKDYILALLAHTWSNKQPWAVLDFYDTSAPTLTDWAAWLGGMTTQQVYTIRESLHASRVIRYDGEDEQTHTGGDSRRVLFNPHWETWDPAIFVAHTPKTGGGRPKTKLASLVAPEVAPEVNTQVYEPSTCKFTGDKPASLEMPAQSSTCKFSGTTRQPRQDAARRGLANKSLMGEGIEKIDTPPSEGVAASRRSASSAPQAGTKATSQTTTSATTSAKTPAKGRKLTDEQLAAKRVEEDYIAALFTGVQEANDGQPIPNKAQERAAAHWFYRYPGGPAPVEQVLALYRLEMLDPFWATQFLSLQSLSKKYGPYLRNPAGYETAIRNKVARAAQVNAQPSGSTSGAARPWRVSYAFSEERRRGSGDHWKAKMAARAAQSQSQG